MSKLKVLKAKRPIDFVYHDNLDSLLLQSSSFNSLASFSSSSSTSSSSFFSSAPFSSSSLLSTPLSSTCSAFSSSASFSSEKNDPIEVEEQQHSKRQRMFSMPRSLATVEDSEEEQKKKEPFLHAAELFPIKEYVDSAIESRLQRRKKLLTSSSGVSVEVVKEICCDALAEREQELREEFTRILNSLLREQFENFTRFTQDSVSRYMRKSDASYFS
eukprot:TRINITY_DN1607_c0_g1_i1.p1 TRINITY_DN1607_c0_g1~~TRINITY_DN1607_c0_g1_i1.p1  ORF type:complete len:241 (+),score=56.82 TRINITY_DN1607_c0_g1_i1:77-724(+)